MHLTEDRLRRIALDARAGLSEALNMIVLHGGDSRRAYLNPVGVLTTVATWERFVYDLLSADSQADWTIERAGHDERPGRAFPPIPPKASRWHDDLDQVAGSTGAVTDHWVVHLSDSGWWGVEPRSWRTASWSGEPTSTNRELIERHLRGAVTARHAVAHRIWHKQAARAADEEGLYTWRADTAVDGGRPTIQQGYVRGVVALFIQLIDITIECVGTSYGWSVDRWQLPSGWFAATIENGPAEGMTLWGGHELYR